MAMREQLHIDGQMMVSVRRWQAPGWLNRLPSRIQTSNRFLRLIRPLGGYSDWDTPVGQLDVADVLTQSGRDWMHAQVYTNSGAGSQGANYMALSTNTSGTAATDSTLTGELTTSDMKRVQVTPTHSASSSTTSFAYTFTATTTQSGIQKGALMNASSTTTYTMAHEGTFTATTLQPNDQLAFSVTTSLG